MRVSSLKQIALVLRLDYEPETLKVPFANLYTLLPPFADPPTQALPICQLEGVSDPELKNKILKPFMQEAVQLRVSGTRSPAHQTHQMRSIDFDCC